MTDCRNNYLYFSKFQKSISSEQAIFGANKMTRPSSLCSNYFHLHPLPQLQTTSVFRRTDHSVHRHPCSPHVQPTPPNPPAVQQLQLTYAGGRSLFLA